MFTKSTHLLAVSLLSLGLLAGCGTVPGDSPESGQAGAGAGEDGRALGRSDGSSAYLNRAGGGANDPSGRGGAGGELEHRVYFDLNSAIIDARAADVLAQNARWLGKRNVTVEGHCDERGTREYNLALGQKRADAAKQYLISQGIDASRIKTVSYGKERPLVNGHNEAAWGKNRRAELVP
ncbi:MAG: peptidoglycan-associated lipoprotein Pal [Magnetococcales bacterium]|nr:peptidoglycan-associated lipoprotein Pal [Magnetococcales bacterium]NGZ05807.1 peptidoglycan-associated lipoprotein Pal [Magnetococcales bacterium]